MTYSIVAYDEETDSYGAGVKASLPCVGGLVPNVSRRGAVCSQAFGNMEMGVRAMQLLDMGVDIQAAVRVVVEEDYAPEFRQVHGVGERGRTGAYTGERTVENHGHREGHHYSVAGNILSSVEVVDAIAEAFEQGQGKELSERIVDALAAGEEAGGEALADDWPRPGSAGVLVAAPEPRWHHSIRVDASRHPLEDLRRVHEQAVEAGEWAADFFQGTVITPLYWRVSRDPQPPPPDAEALGSKQPPDEYTLRDAG